jgi:hypothetical protein
MLEPIPRVFRPPTRKSSANSTTRERLLRPKTKRNSRSVGRSHRKTQLLLPRLVIRSLHTLQLLYQTYRHVRCRIDSELVADAHPWPGKKRYVRPVGRRARPPSFRPKDVSIGSPVFFSAMKAVQRDQECCSFDHSDGRFAIGTAASG